MDPVIIGPLALIATIGLLVLIKIITSAQKRKPGPQKRVRLLIHSINDDRCTGCDACVTVCPTGASFKRAADGIVLIGAHAGEGYSLRKWLDPSLTDESDVFAVDPRELKDVRTRTTLVGGAVRFAS